MSADKSQSAAPNESDELEQDLLDEVVGKAMEMTPLQTLRHSTAHVMAAAVQKLFPEAKVTIGPPIDTGFYYDFDVERPFTDEDLERIEAEMQTIIKSDAPFVRKEISRAEALEMFQRCRSALSAQGVEPAPEIRAVYDRLIAAA